MLSFFLYNLNKSYLVQSKIENKQTNGVHVFCLMKKKPEYQCNWSAFILSTFDYGHTVISITWEVLSKCTLERANNGLVILYVENIYQFLFIRMTGLPLPFDLAKRMHSPNPNSVVNLCAYILSFSVLWGKGLD